MKNMKKMAFLSLVALAFSPVNAADAEVKSEEKVVEAAAEKPVKKVAKKAKRKAAKAHKTILCDKAPTLPAQPTVSAGMPTLNQNVDGYMRANDNLYIGVHGMFKGVVNYDMKGFGGDDLTAGNIPFGDVQENKTHLSAHAKTSRVRLDVLSKTGHGDANGILEFDFYKEPSDVKTMDSTGSNSHSLRMRHAYVTYKGFLFGQTDSLFVSYPQVKTIDFTGHFGGGLRQYQIRYTHDFNANVDAAIALENGSVDAKNNTPYVIVKSNEQIPAPHNASIYREKTLPDFTAKATYKMGGHSVGLRGLVRQLSIKEVVSSTRTESYKKTGYGVGLDAKLETTPGSAFVAMINYGKGIGRYISEHDGQSMVVDTTVRKAALQRIVEWGVGYGHVFCENWSANLGYSTSQVAKDRLNTTSLRNQTKKLERMFVNIIFSPIKDLNLGLEYIEGRRESDKDTNQRVLKGKRSRVVFGVEYKF